MKEGAMSFTELERDILATLEEAGENDLAALLNTVRECRGSIDEIEAYRAALTRLVKNNFLDIAKFRGKVSRRWIQLAQHESIALVTNVGSLLHWSPLDRLWNFPGGSPRLQVVLTDAGLAVAREILSKHGWPLERAPWVRDST